MDALISYIAQLGGRPSDARRHIASKLGVAEVTVRSWLNGHRRLTDTDVLAVSAATDWHVLPHALRQDLYPNPTDGLPEDIRAQVEAGKWPPEPDQESA